MDFKLNTDDRIYLVMAGIYFILDILAPIYAWVTGNTGMVSGWIIYGVCGLILGLGIMKTLNTWLNSNIFLILNVLVLVFLLVMPLLSFILAILTIIFCAVWYAPNILMYVSGNVKSYFYLKKIDYLKENDPVYNDEEHQDGYDDSDLDEDDYRYLYEQEHKSKIKKVLQSKGKKKRK